MAVMKYLKEFAYGVSAICVLLAAASAVIVIFLAPFGLMIYLGDVLGYHDVIAFASVLMCYAIY